MHKRKLLTIAIILVIVLLLTIPLFVSARPLLAAAPGLGTLSSFAVLGNQTVTNTGSSLIYGNLGVSPGSSVTGFPPGIVVVPGVIHAGDATASQAQNDLTTATNGLTSQACDITFTPPTDLGGLTLTPGVYCFGSSAALTGTLTLNAQGDPNAVWVFKMGSTLTTATGSQVVFINGGSGPGCNVFWQVGTSATIGTTSTFVGNIFAAASITMNTNASLAGRALAQTGSVTLDTNIVQPIVCATATATPLPPTDTQTAIANTQTAIPPTLTAIALTPTLTLAPPTQTAIAATETVIAATNTVIPATLTAIVPTLTSIAATNTATAIAPTLTAIATNTRIAATLTAIAATKTATATRVAPTLTAIAATRTATAIKPTLTNTPTITLTNTPAAIPAVLPKTGFAPQRVSVLSAQPAEKAYASFSTASSKNQVLGDLWLEIPRLGVQIPIVGVPQTNGEWDVSWLGNDAGWLNGTAFPTWAGNSVLTGHVYDADGNPGPFVHLNWLWWGDQVVVHAWGAQYVYAVREVLQVTPRTTYSVIKHEELPWVTLITCRGYDEASNSYNYRVAVRAVLLEVK